MAYPIGTSTDRIHDKGGLRTYVPHRDLHHNDKYDDVDDCVDGLPVCDLHRKDKYVRTTTTTMLTMAAIGK